VLAQPHRPFAPDRGGAQGIEKQNLKKRVGFAHYVGQSPTYHQKKSCAQRTQNRFAFFP